MRNFGSSQQHMQQTAKKGGYKFERFGDTKVCADSCGIIYPYIEYLGLSSSEECGKKCSKCPGKLQGGLLLRGFNYLNLDTVPEFSYCQCLVDFDFGISFDETVCEDEGAADADPLLEGSGEIVNTAVAACAMPGPGPGSPTKISCPECWKVSSPSSSKGRKSNAPKSSKRPVRKLGQNKNDSLLSNVERKTDSQTGWGGGGWTWGGPNEE
eukprot:scaffold39082_cov150-Skeletonema_marinoi.AAC.4